MGHAMSCANAGTTPASPHTTTAPSKATMMTTTTTTTTMTDRTTGSEETSGKSREGGEDDGPNKNDDQLSPGYGCGGVVVGGVCRNGLYSVREEDEKEVEGSSCAVMKDKESEKGDEEKKDGTSDREVTVHNEEVGVELEKRMSVTEPTPLIETPQLCGTIVPRRSSSLSLTVTSGSSMCGGGNPNDISRFVTDENVTDAGASSSSAAEKPPGLPVAPHGLRRLLPPAPTLPRRFNMDDLHPSRPPYLGSSYWIQEEEEEDEEPFISSSTSLPSLSSSSTIGTQFRRTRPIPEGPSPLMASPLDTVIDGDHGTPRMRGESPMRRHMRMNGPSLLNAEAGLSPRVEPGSMESMRTATTGSTEDSGDDEEEEELLGEVAPRRLFGDAAAAEDHDDDDNDDGEGNDEEEDATSQPVTSPLSSPPPAPLSPDRESQASTAYAQASSRPSGVCGSYGQMYVAEGDTSEVSCASQEETPGSSGSEETSDSPPHNFCTTRRVGAAESSPPTHNFCFSRKDSETSLIIHNGVVVRGTPQTPSSDRSTSSNATDSLHHTTSSSTVDPHPTRQRQISTLPSFLRGKPIRLKIRESYEGYTSSSILSNDHDYLENQFSFDPFFSLGEYSIQTASGKPYGNGLSIRMGSQYMSLQDQDGQVIAVTRSRHTFIPSHVVYSPKPRFEGQIPSSHRPILDFARTTTTTSTHVQLYPWALVRKEGRRMDHAVTIHLAETRSSAGGGQTSCAGDGSIPRPNQQGPQPLLSRETSFTSVTSLGSTNTNSLTKIPSRFCQIPAYRSRHGFDSTDRQSHSVVTRVVLRKRELKRTVATGNTTAEDSNPVTIVEEEITEEGEVPCCLIIRDAVDGDVFNLTVAPGVDPLLIVCYLAVHSKMDVEPKMSEL